MDVLPQSGAAGGGNAVAEALPVEKAKADVFSGDALLRVVQQIAWLKLKVGQRQPVGTYGGDAVLLVAGKDEYIAGFHGLLAGGQRILPAAGAHHGYFKLYVAVAAQRPGAGGDGDAPCPQQGAPALGYSADPTILAAASLRSKGVYSPLGWADAPQFLRRYSPTSVRSRSAVGEVS